MLLNIKLEDTGIEPWTCLFPYLLGWAWWADMLLRLVILKFSPATVFILCNIVFKFTSLKNFKLFLFTRE
jgi:hypothetical protein